MPAIYSRRILQHLLSVTPLTQEKSNFIHSNPQDHNQADLKALSSGKWGIVLVSNFQHFLTLNPQKQIMHCFVSVSFSEQIYQELTYNQGQGSPGLGRGGRRLSPCAWRVSWFGHSPPPWVTRSRTALIIKTYFVFFFITNLESRMLGLPKNHKQLPFWDGRGTPTARHGTLMHCIISYNPVTGTNVTVE